MAIRGSHRFASGWAKSPTQSVEYRADLKRCLASAPVLGRVVARATHEIVRASFQNANPGYCALYPQRGPGYIRDRLNAMATWVFFRLGLR